MVFENDVSKIFLREVFNIVVYTLNRVQIRKGKNRTPYELWFGYSPSIKYFKIFGRKYYAKRDDNIGKFEPRSDEGMLLSYSLKNKAYKCFDYRTKTIVECTDVRIGEKFGSKKKMVNYNSDEEEDNFGIVRQHAKVYFETNNDLQNDVLTIEKRGEYIFETIDETIVEM